eukprot:superscaffoldBa00000895_g7871
MGNMRSLSNKMDELGTLIKTQREYPRTVRCFPNNKPWITSDLKVILNKEKKAFRFGDKEELRSVQHNLTVKLRECKESYRKRLETKLQQNKGRDVWTGMKEIIGFKLHTPPPPPIFHPFPLNPPGELLGPKPPTFEVPVLHLTVTTGQFISEGEKPPSSKKTKKSLLEAAQMWEMWVDLRRKLHFLPVVQTSLRPDMAIWSEEVKRIIVIELTVL